MIVTFFGHRDAPESICSDLHSAIAMLIQVDHVNLFLVGNHGNFDKMVASVLKKLKKEYPCINYQIVLAYMPTSKNQELEQTVLADGVENVLPRYAIEKRNVWMIEKSDIVVTYVTRSFGGAARFKAMALARGKRVIELGK